MTWDRASFSIVTPHGVRDVHGYAYAGLGLHMVSAPKGRRPGAWWSLTHLGSGHGVATIRGTVSKAFPVATEIAEAGDWTFDEMFGWRNQFPDVAEKVSAILARHKNASRPRKDAGANEDLAREIMLARSAA